MLVAIELPGPLRAYADGVTRVEAEGETVRQSLDDLVLRFPRLRRHLYDDAGKTRGFVNVFLNDVDVRSLASGEATPVGAGDVIVILPSVSGG
jgi:molybdopterin converting factor small subunit